MSGADGSSSRKRGSEGLRHAFYELDYSVSGSGSSHDPYDDEDEDEVRSTKSLCSAVSSTLTLPRSPGAPCSRGLPTAGSLSRQSELLLAAEATIGVEREEPMSSSPPSDSRCKIDYWGKLQMDHAQSSARHSAVALQPNPRALTLSTDILSALLPPDGDWSLPSSRQCNGAPALPSSHNTGAPTVPAAIHCDSFAPRAAFADGISRARDSRGSYYVADGNDDRDAFGPTCHREGGLPFAGSAPVVAPPGVGDGGARDLRSRLPFVGLPTSQTRLPIASYESDISANDYGHFVRLSYPEARLSYQEKRFRYE